MCQRIGIPALALAVLWLGLLAGPARAGADPPLQPTSVERAGPSDAAGDEPADLSTAPGPADPPAAAAPEPADTGPAGTDAPPEPLLGPAAPDPLFDDAFSEEYDAVRVPDEDPLEKMNRLFFDFNQMLDDWFWEPVTDGYRFAVPEPGRQAVRRAFLNLGSAPVFVNDVLQLRFDDAGETLGRFVLNSTVGMAGLFDAGIEAGWEWHDSDFGETLALYGAPSGPYLVLPVFGPTTVRDGFGDVVDRMFEPLTYIFGIGVLGSSLQVVVGTGTGITTYEAHADDLEQLEQGSIDFYAALRSVYLQNREAEIQEVVDDSWLTTMRRGSAPSPTAATASP